MLPNIEAEAMPDRAMDIARRYQVDHRESHHILSLDGATDAIVFWEAGRRGSVIADRGALLLRSGKIWQVADPAWIEPPLNISIARKSYTVSLQRGRSTLLDSNFR
jgi:hypothetical protein